MDIVEADRARALRRAVLRPAAGPDDALPGDGVDGAVHFAALDGDGAVLSTCFVYPDPWPFPEFQAATGTGWHLRQMATDPDRRGLGAGSAVVERVIIYVQEQGGGTLWCHARVPAIRFYERHGLIPVGEVHPAGDPPIPHRHMYRPQSLQA